MARQCGECVYATTIRNGGAGELVCACVPGFEGRLSYVAAGEGCRSYRAKPTPPLRLEPPVPPSDDIRYIPLTRGLFAIVDASDYEWLSGFKWHATTGRKAYACFSRKDKVIYMHRLIMNPPEGKFVDHHDGNSLNYRRCNLRLCNKAQNAWNRPAVGGTSRFKGVYRNKDGKWKAGIRVGGQQTFIGLFDDEIEAAKAYDGKARELFGEFAYLNFPATGRIVRLEGRICAHSRASATLTVVSRHHRQTGFAAATRPLKSETRISKFETNSKIRNPKLKTEHNSAPILRHSEPGRGVWSRVQDMACSGPDVSTSLRAAFPERSRGAQHDKIRRRQDAAEPFWLLGSYGFGHCFRNGTGQQTSACGGVVGLRTSYFEFPPAPLEGVGPGP